MADITVTGNAPVVINAHGKVLMIEQAAEASTPGAGKGVLYARDDGSLHYKNDGGSDYALTDGIAMEAFPVSGDGQIGEVGYIDTDGAFAKIAQEAALVPWCVVVKADAGEVTVVRRGVVEVAYTGTAPTAGQFLVTSATSGQAQAALLNPRVFAVCLEDGADGMVRALLLTQRSRYAINSTQYILMLDSFTRSGFYATINSFPNGAIAYENVVGDEDSLVYNTNPVYSKHTSIVLHNLEDNRTPPFVRVASANTVANTINPVEALGNWAQNDRITTRSRENEKVRATDMYYIDLSVKGHQDAPVFPVGVELLCWLYNASTAINLYLHPLRAWDAGSESIFKIPAVSWWPEAGLQVELTDRRFTAQFGKAGSSAVQMQLTGWTAAEP